MMFLLITVIAALVGFYYCVRIAWEIIA